MPDVKHTPGYFEAHDIDWFCQINSVNIHVASMGRPIPEGIMESLPQVYEQVSMIEMEEWRGGEGFWINDELLRNWLHIEDTQKIARYLYTFVVMARKGFYSFAPITFDSSDGDYYLMAKPQNPVHKDIRGIVSIEKPNLDLQQVGPYEAVSIGELIEG